MTAITIVALQDPIAIVHIPITSSSHHSTRLYWTLEYASEGSSEFFNITSNCIELAIFASVELVNSQWIDPSLDPSIKISQSSWRVFEISSGDQGETGNYDSPHLRHVSAPLAKAGITILYQSSYFTDFILVKEVDFDKAAAIFAEQGWNVDRSAMSSPTRRRSQLLSPLSPEPSPPPYSTSPTRSASDHSPMPEITVLSSPLACIGFSRSAEGRTFEKIRQLIIWPRRAEVSWKRRSSFPDLESSLSSIPPTPNTSSRRSPMAASFHVEARSSPRPFLSFTRTIDGSSLISSVKVFRDMFGAQKEGEVMELNEEVYFGDGDLFESSDESLRSGRDDESSDDEVPEVVGEVTTSTPRTSPRRSPRHMRSRPLSLPITPRDSPVAGKTHGEIPIQWSTTDAETTLSLSTKKSKGGRVSWIEPEPAREDDSDTEGGAWHDDCRGTLKRKSGKGRKRCLQLDLRGLAEDQSEESEEVYHMDKSGLVTLFSNLLNSANIRMLYSSTFHTANILVDAGDVRRAKKLLSSK